MVVAICRGDGGALEADDKTSKYMRGIHDEDGNKISQINRGRGVDTASVVDCKEEATASRFRDEHYTKRDRREQREYVTNER